MSLKVPLWKNILKTNFTRVDQLAESLKLPIESLSVNQAFVLSVPIRLVEKMEKGNIHDPILRQYVPLKDETKQYQGFVAEPVSDSSFSCTSRMLQKYHGRVLLVLTSACAMHCRYCFRQNFDYDSLDRLYQEEIALIEEDLDIHEVILSGGDPLSLSDEVLATLLRRLDEIPHVKEIRFHTRFPIGIPERIDDHFLQVLGKIKTQIWFVVHINHPKEIDEDVAESLGKVRKLGIPILNQSVLLRGVNDSEEVLAELSHLLIANGIIPYYLHQLDRVQGAGHFEVSQEEGVKLIEKLTKRLPGYAIPRYVQEIPFQPSKTRIL